MIKAAPLLALLLAAPAAAADLSVSGSLKSFLHSVRPAVVRGLPGQPGGEYTSAENKLRLKSYTRLGDALKAEAAYELAYTARRSALAAARPLSRGHEYRVSDPEPLLFPADSDPAAPSFLVQNLDRAFITWSPPAFDLYAGRQAVAFGSARSVNPTDVLAPYPFGTIDTENRRGVDALRIRVPRGDMGELDAGWLPGERWAADSGAGFLRGRGTAAGADIKLIAAAFRGNLLAGADAERSLGGAMLRAEAAQVWAGSLGERTPGDDFFRLTAGAEYNFSFSGGTDAWLEYHFNGAGSGRPETYPALSARTAYAEGNVHLLGRHYLSGGAGLQVSPLVTAGLSSLLNLGDRSFYLLPAVEWNAAENIYISAGALLPSGPGARLSGLAAVPASEFGLYDRLLYASLRAYF